MVNKNNIRQSPYSLSAEKAVLGCLLINKEAIHRTIHSLSINAFYEEAHKTIYAAICNMFESGQIVDSVTITDYLKKNKNLKNVGDSYYITGLVEDAPSSENVDHYSEIVKQKYTLRTIINTAIEMSTEAYNEEHDPIEILDQAEKKIFELSQQTERGEFVSINPILEEVLKEWGTKTDTGLFGIPSGFIDLDEKLSGFQKSDLIIVAGRPSMGKTALCLSIARNVAIDHNKKVGIFSLEMSKKQLGERLISSESRINSHKIKTSQLPKGDWRKLSTAANSLSNSKIFIDDSPGLNVMELRAKARQLKAEKKIDILIVDYIQLLNAGTRSENRQQEMSYISRSLKALAKELDIPIICLSQLSRAVENRTNHRPVMSDLRESGAIEQDADVVLFIYRQFVYTEAEEDKNIGEIIIAKHRNGPTGTAKVTFIADYARFENYEYSDRMSDVPFS
jgi:replicative DNA helicase